MWDVLRWALIWASVGTALTMVTTFSWSLGVALPPKPRSERPSSTLGRSLDQVMLPVSASWSFKDSWAANLTGLITAFAAIVAAFKDSLSTVVPATEVARFAVVSALATGVTALAPMIYATFTGTKEDEDKLPVATGTLTGLILASGATLAGLFGALGGVGWIAVGRNGDDVLTSAIGWCLLLVSGLVLLYAARTLLRLLTWAAGTTVETHAVADIVSVSCCGGNPIGVAVKLL